MTIRIDINDALKSLNRLEQILERPKPFLELIAEELYLVGRQAFEEERSPDGQPWMPLSLRYGAWKAKRFPGRGILRLRGQLIRSLRRGTEPEARIAFATAGPLGHAAVHQHGFSGTVNVRGHRRKVKTRDIYAKVQVRSQRRRRKIASGLTFVNPFSRRMNIPARPYLGFPPESQQRVVKEIEELSVQVFDGKAKDR